MSSVSYQYPIDIDWTKEEVIKVITFFQHVEKAYETGVKKDDFMITYKGFKQVVPGKGDEKQICQQFDEESGYSCYRAVQEAKKTPDGQKIRLKPNTKKRY